MIIADFALITSLEENEKKAGLPLIIIILGEFIMNTAAYSESILNLFLFIFHTVPKSYQFTKYIFCRSFINFIISS